MLVMWVCEIFFYKTIRRGKLMKIRLGPAGVPISSKKRDSVRGVKTVAELGLNAMEIEFVRGVNLSSEKARELGEIADFLGVELSVHAPYYINLASEDEKKIKASIERILLSAERAHEMGAKIVVVHAGYYGKNKEAAHRKILEACKLIVEKIESSGWDVKIGLETMGKLSQWGTLEEIKEVWKETKLCIPVVDFAHIYARNGGSIDYSEIFDKLKSFKLKHLHAHFSGISFTKTLAGGNEKKHLPIREAKGPSFEPLAKEILKRKANITIISESPILERDALYMKEVFEKLGYRF